MPQFGAGDARLRASVDVAAVTIGTVAVRGLQASAAVGCDGGAVTRSGRSRVLSLTVAGRQLGTVDGPVNLALPAVGTLHLNEVTDTPDGLSVRALRLESLLGDVVVGEARADLGSPACPSGLITIRAQTIQESSQAFSFTGDLGNFVLDGRPQGGPSGERTFRKPPGRYRVADRLSPGTGWRLEAVQCQDRVGSSRTDARARAAVIDLQGGAQVVCSFRYASTVRPPTPTPSPHPPSPTPTDLCPGRQAASALGSFEPCSSPPPKPPPPPPPSARPSGTIPPTPTPSGPPMGPRPPHEPEMPRVLILVVLVVGSLAVLATGLLGDGWGRGPGWLAAPLLPGAREVRTGFAPMGDPGRAVERTTGLAAGRPYYFWLELGPPVGSDAREQRIREGALLPAAGLTVTLFGFDGELLIETGESRGELTLDPEGRARVARHGRVPRGGGTGAELLGRRVFFPVRTPKRWGDQRLRCNLYCGQTLVQSHLVHAHVRHPLRQLLAERLRPLRRRLWRKGRTLIGAEVDFALSRTLDPAHLSKLQPHALSVLMNGDEGTHGFRLLGQGGFTSSASFDDAEVQDFGDRLREALRHASCGDQDVPRDRYRTPGEAQLAEDLILFARRGWRVWSGLVRRLAQGAPGAGPPERRLAALLRTSSRIQFVAKMGARHRLPASMIYDAPLDANLPDLTLCPAFRDALSAEAPLEDTPCFRGNCPSWGDRRIVCPSGFWGFRHVIGMPSSLGSEAGAALDVATEIAFGDAPTFVVGVSTDPAFVERSRHEQALRSLYPGLDWQYGDTREKVLDLLERTQPHLVYLYCHGGSSKGSDFVEVGPPGGPVLTGDDLMFRVWWEETHPLVFVNGCHTTAVSPETALELVTAFVERQASGVIGTEVTVFEHLAGRFAEECLGRLLQGASIGDAVRTTRLALLKSGNPLGLVYVAFVTDELRMMRSGAEPTPTVGRGVVMAGSSSRGIG